MNHPEEIIRKRVREVMSQFSEDEIPYWVIVNEPGSSWRRRDDVLYQKLGDRYVEIAFEEARRVNPNVKLVLSDGANHFYRANHPETYPETDKDLRLIMKLKRQGLIDAIGLHCHINRNEWSPLISPEEFRAVLEMYKSKGVEVYITEFDINLYNIIGEGRFLNQAKLYYQYMKAYLESGAGNIVSFWGLRDSESWIETWIKQPNGDPLLFDDNGNTKMSYYAILKVLFEEALRRGRDI